MPATFGPDLLAGKTALVTGGSRGLGRSIARAFANAGAEVVIASRKRESVERTATELSAETGGKVFPIAAHVGEWQQCDALIEETLALVGRLDVLVNNAGIA